MLPIRKKAEGFLFNYIQVCPSNCKCLALKHFLSIVMLVSFAYNVQTTPALPFLVPLQLTPPEQVTHSELMDRYCWLQATKIRLNITKN